MSLAHRVIPTILCRGRTQVKGVGFDSSRSVGHAAQAVKVHGMRGVDEVVLLDVSATREGRGPDLALVEELSGIFSPLAVGGGVQSVADVRALLALGADKVVLCSRPEAIASSAAVVGSQAIVVSIDVRDGAVHFDCGRTRAHPPLDNPVRWAQAVQAVGAGEILLQSVERDGTMQGYDLDLINKVARAVNIPVIASGGCSGYEDMRLAIEAGASAVAAGALFQFTDATPRGAAQYLSEKGVEVRL